jgi:hypothetical protein
MDRRIIINADDFTPNIMPHTVPLLLTGNNRHIVCIKVELIKASFLANSDTIQTVTLVYERHPSHELKDVRILRKSLTPFCLHKY